MISMSFSQYVLYLVSVIVIFNTDIKYFMFYIYQMNNEYFESREESEDASFFVYSHIYMDVGFFRFG